MSELKTCYKCKEPKSLDEFYKDKSRPDGHNGRCIPCCKLYSQTPERRANNRKSHFKTTFGITPEEWEAEFAAQGSRCASCASTVPGWEHGWHTDHSHTTGKVCGILCHSCNTALGKMGDNPERVLMLYRYAVRTRTQELRVA